MKMSPQASWRMAALLRRKAARLLPSQADRYREMARDFEWLARAKAKHSKRRTTRIETRSGVSENRLPKPWAAGWTFRRAPAAMPLAVPPCRHSRGSPCSFQHLSRKKAATDGDANDVNRLPDADAQKVRPRPVVQRAIF
jgi:hypothetical protein